MKELPDQAIEYSNIQTQLRIAQKLKLSKADIVDMCRALSKMAAGYVYARTNTVEITQRPNIILAAISSTIREYPEEEQRKIPITK